MKTTTIYTRILFVCMIAMPITVLSQKRDSLAIIREFLQVSSSYQQMPLYLELEMKNATNFITGEQDTMQVAGKFYFQPGSAYLQLGEMEQWVTDSVAVLVSNNLQRIIISTQTRRLADQMKALTGSMLKDSSIVATAKKYTAVHKIINGNPVIELNSRDLVPGSAWPRQTILMTYRSKTKQPLEMGSVNRMLVPLSEEDYKQLATGTELEKMLVATESNKYFLIREQATSFTYKSVSHEASIKIPVAVSDRIVKNGKGGFEPVKAYEGYEITMN